MIGTISTGLMLAMGLAFTGVRDIRRHAPGAAWRNAWFGWICLASAVAMLACIGLCTYGPLPTSAMYAIVFPAAVSIVYGLIRTRPTPRPNAADNSTNAPRLVVVDELTASIAHEINQPLGAILSNTDAAEILLEREHPPLDEIRQILGDIRRDGLRASAVIRNVRTLARRRALSVSKLDANEVVRGAVSLMEPDMRRRGIHVQVLLPPQGLFVLGDRVYLEQVLLNLVINAMDAMEALDNGARRTGGRGAVVLSVAQTERGHVQFQVTDAGQGIPADRLAHLFDSFYTSKPHGMGLGLSIARSIVEAHGGSIQAENNCEGGATFRVTIPGYEALPR